MVLIAATILQFLSILSEHFFKRFLISRSFRDDLELMSNDLNNELQEQADSELRRRENTWECWDCQSYDLQPSIHLVRHCPRCLHYVEETVYFDCACGWSNDHGHEPQPPPPDPPYIDPLDPWGGVPPWAVTEWLGRENL